MIVRYIEVCPNCGQWDPWRKVTSKVVKGHRRVYAKCKRCGKRETIEYRHASESAPERGTILGG